MLDGLGGYAAEEGLVGGWVDGWVGDEGLEEGEGLLKEGVYFWGEGAAFVDLVVSAIGYVGGSYCIVVRSDGRTDYLILSFWLD